LVSSLFDPLSIERCEWLDMINDENGDVPFLDGIIDLKTRLDILLIAYRRWNNENNTYKSRAVMDLEKTKSTSPNPTPNPSSRNGNSL
jgi:hypothetical protein